ncbi:MucBP domain-containing protein, partial [Bacillus cytotoxicus]
MRNKTKRFRKICLASGIIFAQVSALGTFSTTAYAITDNQVSDFVIKANKDQVKEGENITLAIKEVHSQGQEIEVVIPDGLHFDEKETAKLNEKNDAIETIRMIEQSVVQIKRTSESANLGELFVVVKGEKAGQYTITAKMKEENKEVETKTSILTVSKNVKENKEQSVQKSEGNESKKAKEPLQLEKQEEKVTTVEEKKEETEKIKQVEPKEKKQKSTMQSNQALYAAPTTGRIQQLDYFKNGATNVIPLEDIFMMRITSETKVIDSKGYFKNNTLKVDPQNPTGSVLIENVGYYKGKKVILKVDVTNKGKGWSEVFMGSLMMNLGPGGAMDVEYSFLDEEGNPLPIKTSLAYRGFNRDKVIGIYNFEQKIKNIYTRQDASINYEIRPSGTYLFTSEAGGWRDEKDEVDFTTKETTSFKLYLENRISDTNSVEYLQEYRARIEIPKIEEKNQIFTSANDTGLSATFIQEIPFIADSTRYINNLSYVVNADIGNQYAKSKWIVTDLQNKDWTNGFTFKDNSDGTTTITAKPETLKNGDFYDKVYLFKEVYDFVGSESEPVDKSRLTPENQYPIHFEVSQSFDKYINYEKVSGTTLINYMGQVQVQHIDKETNQPIPNVQDTIVEGIITDPFRVNPIEIPGYQVVKDEPITGRFLPEKQTVAHIYAPIKANLEANDFSTVIGSIPTNPEELKTFILKEAKAEATELP